MGKLRIGLVSKSPRRYKLLKELGFDVVVLSHEVTTEDVEVTTTDPCSLVIKNAMRKLRSTSKIPKDIDYLLAIDTMVFIDDKALSKPSSKHGALTYLKFLNGKCHEVYSGVALRRVSDGVEVTGCEGTVVCFDVIDDEALRLYVETGEPMDKAGAYAIQDLGKLLVKEVHGDFYNVMGLPIVLLKRLFKELGLDFTKYTYEQCLKDK